VGELRSTVGRWDPEHISLQRSVITLTCSRATAPRASPIAFATDCISLMPWVKSAGWQLMVPPLLSPSLLRSSGGSIRQLLGASLTVTCASE